MLKVSHTFCSCHWGSSLLCLNICKPGHSYPNEQHQQPNEMHICSQLQNNSGKPLKPRPVEDWVSGFPAYQINFGGVFPQASVGCTWKRSGTYFHLGNLAMLKEKINSIPFHLSNRHFFPSNKHHTKCSHGELEGRAWLDPDSKVEFW